MTEKNWNWGVMVLDRDEWRVFKTYDNEKDARDEALRLVKVWQLPWYLSGIVKVVRSFHEELFD